MGKSCLDYTAEGAVSYSILFYIIQKIVQKTAVVFFAAEKFCAYGVGPFPTSIGVTYKSQWRQCIAHGACHV